MTTLQQLKKQFGIRGQLDFKEDASGLIIAEISNYHANTALCLQGAHLMTWHPWSQDAPVLWLSRDARLAPGKPIRGGVPVCWPWFGAHPSEADYPAHGYARTSPWEVVESSSEPEGATRLVLRLSENEKTRMHHSGTLSMSVTVGETLRMELTTENTGETDFVISEALHAYFQIGDIDEVRITGLEGADYWDKVGDSTLKKQEGAIRFSEETDRIYIDSAAECVIEDDRIKRRIHITKTGSLSTVVWSPWTAKAARMGDLGQPDGWRKMVCVESANAADNAVKVAAGGRHTLAVEYRVEPLP